MSLNAHLQSTKSSVSGVLLRVSFVAVAFLPAVSCADTEIQKLWIEIRNSRDQPIEGIRVKCRGHSEFSYPSTPTGLAELPLPPGIRPGDQIEIELEPGSDLAKKWTFLKPFGGNINVLSPKQRYYTILLVQRWCSLQHRLQIVTPSHQTRDVKIDQFDRPPTPLSRIRNQRP